MSSISTTSEKKEESLFYQKYKEQIKILEEKTGINGKYVILALLFCSLLVFIGICESTITNLVGIVLPAFLSMKAIETLEMDNEKQWITYWVIFAFWSVIDGFSFLFLKYIPFYYFIKIVVLMWLFMPNLQGAFYLYENYIFNMFKKIEAFIDKYHQNKRTSFENHPFVESEMIKQNKKDVVQQQPANINVNPIENPAEKKTVPVPVVQTKGVNPIENPGEKKTVVPVPVVQTKSVTETLAEKKEK
jgi:receptor expression-enhancing protein 5/6